MDGATITYLVGLAVSLLFTALSEKERRQSKLRLERATSVYPPNHALRAVARRNYRLLVALTMAQVGFALVSSTALVFDPFAEWRVLLGRWIYLGVQALLAGLVVDVMRTRGRVEEG